jgi:glycogen debranching enzyme
LNFKSLLNVIFLIKDYINFYARQNDDKGNHQYSEWIADAAYNAYLLNGDKEFIKSNLEGFVKIYDKWSDHFEPKLGLYFIAPLLDAQEYSAASVQTKDKFAGGIGYRPSHNSEMYANAIAITKIAHLANDAKTETDFKTRAKALREAIITHLWDKERNHFYHMQRFKNYT